MKYILILCVLISTLGSCANNGCSYSKWETEDGWSYSFGELEKYPNITFEYPGCFQIFTDEVYKEISVGIDITPGMEDIVYNSIEFGRSVNEQEELKVSIKNGALSRIRVTLHTSDWLTVFTNNFEKFSTDNETFIDFIAKQFSNILNTETSTE